MLDVVSTMKLCLICFVESRRAFGIFNTPDGLKLRVMETISEINVNTSRSIWQSPHFHCFTWMAGGSFKVIIYNMNENDVMSNQCSAVSRQ